MKSEEIVREVRRSTLEVFSTMLELDLVALPVENERSTPPVSYGVMSFVGLSGVWAGMGVLSCGAELACRLSERFTMAEAASVDESVLDVVGELANIIVGNFKTAAEGIVGSLGLSVPTVVYGKNFMSKSLGNKDWIVMPFSCSEGRFEVRIWFAPTSAYRGSEATA